MAQLSSLIPLVRERCGGVLDQMAKDQLGRAYQKFCYESRFLARTQEIEKGQSGELSIDDDHTFVSVDFVLDANGAELKDENVCQFPAWENRRLISTSKRNAFQKEQH